MVLELVEVESEKSPVLLAVTVRVTVTLWLSLPVLPVIAMGWLVPAGVDEEVQSVKVEVPTPLIEAGLKPAVTPAGSPGAFRATLLLNPLAKAEVETV